MWPLMAKLATEAKEWLEENPSNKLLFVIDEAHMYRGSSGGEVAFIMRRMFHKLGITRERVQFTHERNHAVCTSAFDFQKTAPHCMYGRKFLLGADPQPH